MHYPHIIPHNVQAALAKKTADKKAAEKALRNTTDPGQWGLSTDPKQWGLEKAPLGALTSDQLAQAQKDTVERMKKTYIMIKQIEATLPLEKTSKKKAELMAALAALKATLTVPAKPSNAGGRKLV